MKFAVVGYGKMGRFYDGLLNAAYIVDVCPVPQRVCFANVDEFIAFGQPVDLVIVSSPMSSHYPIAKKLLTAGYNLLVEKPIALVSSEAQELEVIAKDKGLILYQSTLERYNPLIKFLRNNLPAHRIASIESYRFGLQPKHAYPDDAKFDLGVHDVDLWFGVFRGIPWTVNAGYGEPRREIIVHEKNGETTVLDLMHKFIITRGHTLDFSKASPNNPILEMIYDLLYRGREMNENWSREIEVLERAEQGAITLR